MFVFDTYLLSFRLLTRRGWLSRFQAHFCCALWIGVVLNGLLISCVALSAQDKKPNKLAISYPSISGAQAVLWIAKETGIFRDNGLDVDLVYIGGGPRSMAALLSGQLQIIGTGGNALWRPISTAPRTRC